MHISENGKDRFGAARGNACACLHAIAYACVMCVGKTLSYVHIFAHECVNSVSWEHMHMYGIYPSLNLFKCITYMCTRMRIIYTRIHIGLRTYTLTSTRTRVNTVELQKVRQQIRSGQMERTQERDCRLIKAW